MNYTLEQKVEKIDCIEFIANYRDAHRVEGYCKECHRYGNYWSCPPFNFDIDCYLSGFKYCYIIGTKITLTSLQADIKDILQRVRLDIDAKLIEIEASHSNTRVFFAGTCQLCQECAKGSGQPCVMPDRVRYSLEALGFDLTKCASEILHTELKWGKDGSPPEYILLMSALFANNYNIKL